MPKKLVPLTTSVVAFPACPEDGLTPVTSGCTNGTMTVWLASAEGPPFRLTVCPVNAFLVEVPSVSVMVTEAVKLPPSA